MGNLWERVFQLTIDVFDTGEPEIGEPINILIVEDEPVIAVIIKNELEESPLITTIIENNPGKALESINKREIDCVISDYDMPQKTGIELLRDVREHYPDLPFILFTGKGSEHIAEEAFAAGATDYLIKGPDEETFNALEQRVKNAVQHSRDTKWRKKSIRRQYLAIILALISIAIGIISIII